MAEGVSDRGQPSAVVGEAGDGTGRVDGAELVAQGVVLVPPGRAVHIDDLDGQAQCVVGSTGRAAVRAGDGGEVAVVVVGVAAGVPQLVGDRGQQVGAGPGAVRAVALGVGPAGEAPLLVVVVDGGAAEGVGVAVGAVEAVVGKSAGQEAVGPGAAHTAVGPVVLPAVPAVVAVDAFDDAARLVVVEARGAAERVGDRGEVAVVVAVASQDRAGVAVLGAEEAECHDAAAVGVDGDAVSTAVPDLEGGAVVIPPDVDPVAVAVGYGLQREGDPAGRSLRRGHGSRQEVQGVPGAAVRDQHLAGRCPVPAQLPAGAVMGEHGGVRGGHVVREQHAVGGGEDEAPLVGLQALVEGGGPGTAEPLTAAVGRQVGALDDEIEQAGQAYVGLGEDHLARHQVDGVAALAAAARGLRRAHAVPVRSVPQGVVGVRPTGSGALRGALGAPALGTPPLGPPPSGPADGCGDEEGEVWGALGVSPCRPLRMSSIADACLASVSAWFFATCRRRSPVSW